MLRLTVLATVCCVWLFACPGSAPSPWTRVLYSTWALHSGRGLKIEPSGHGACPECTTTVHANADELQVSTTVRRCVSFWLQLGDTAPVHTQHRQRCMLLEQGSMLLYAL